MKRNLILILLTAGLLFVFASCSQIKTQHEVKAHITIDVNIKIDKELDDFFGDLDEEDETLETTDDNSTR